jgi:fatty-acyl-CoA synthase
MIICNGRNIWPQDLEWSVEALPAVRSGGVAAFSVAGPEQEEQVVVVVECYTNNPAQRRALEEDVVASVHRSAGVPCEIVLVAPRSLPYTSSGKLSRATAKSQYLNGSLTPVDAPDRSGAEAAALQTSAG